MCGGAYTTILQLTVTDITMPTTRRASGIHTTMRNTIYPKRCGLKRPSEKAWSRYNRKVTADMNRTRDAWGRDRARGDAFADLLLQVGPMCKCTASKCTCIFGRCHTFATKWKAGEHPTGNAKRLLKESHGQFIIQAMNARVPELSSQSGDDDDDDDDERTMNTVSNKSLELTGFERRRLADAEFRLEELDELHERIKELEAYKCRACAFYSYEVETAQTHAECVTAGFDKLAASLGTREWGSVSKLVTGTTRTATEDALSTISDLKDRARRQGDK